MEIFENMFWIIIGSFAISTTPLFYELLCKIGGGRK
tara:strand:+ start:321 stop:428 length:108 start_codon:yes stop_codon:yes gene_type:complete